MNKHQQMFKNKASFTDIYSYLTKIKNLDINKILKNKMYNILDDIIHTCLKISKEITPQEYKNPLNENILASFNLYFKIHPNVIFYNCSYSSSLGPLSYLIIFNNDLAQFNNQYFEKLEKTFKILLGLAKPKLTYTLSTRQEQLNYCFPYFPNDILKLINEFCGIGPSDIKALEQFFEYLVLFKNDYYNKRLYAVDTIQKVTSMLNSIYYQETNLVPSVRRLSDNKLSTYYNVLCASYLTNLPMMPEYLKYFKQFFRILEEKDIYVYPPKECNIIDNYLGHYKPSFISKLKVCSKRSINSSHIIDDKQNEIAKWTQILINEFGIGGKIADICPTQIDVLIIPQSVSNLSIQSDNSIENKSELYNRLIRNGNLKLIKNLDKNIRRRNGNDIILLKKFSNTVFSKKQALNKLMSNVKLEQRKRYIVIIDRSCKNIQINKLGTYHKNSPFEEMLYLIELKKKWNKVNHEEFLLPFIVNSNNLFIPWRTYLNMGCAYDFRLSFHIIAKNYVNIEFHWDQSSIKFNQKIVNKVWKKIFVKQEYNEKLLNYECDEEFNSFIKLMIDFYKDKLESRVA